MNATTKRVVLFQIAFVYLFEFTYSNYVQLYIIEIGHGWRDMKNT